MVQDDGPVGLDGVRVAFDDERVVSDAGLMLAATLAARLGIEDLAQRFVRLRPQLQGASNAGRELMSLIYAMALGADSIDDCELLRSGRSRRLLGGWVAAPSTLGTFLRAFTFGHVRQLDRVLAETLTRAWQAGAGPGDGRLTVDVDSFIGEVHGHAKQGAAFGYTRKRGYHPIVALRAETREVLHPRLRKGSANTQRGILRFADELIARVARAGAGRHRLWALGRPPAGLANPAALALPGVEEGLDVSALRVAERDAGEEPPRLVGVRSRPRPPAARAPVAAVRLTPEPAEETDAGTADHCAIIAPRPRVRTIGEWLATRGSW